MRKVVRKKNIQKKTVHAQNRKVNKAVVAIVSGATVGLIAYATLTARGTVWIYERGTNVSADSIATLDGNTAGIETTFLKSTKNPVELYHSDHDHWKFTGYTTKDGTPVDNSVKSVVGEKDVYANFEPETYKVSLVKDGETISDNEVQYGDTFLPAVDVADGHPYENFVGWDTGDGIVAGIPAVDKDEVLTAKYEGKTYKITYDLDGGTAENPDSYVYGTGVTSFADASKDGYIFDGWFSDADKTQQVASLGTDAHDDVTLYAKFHEKPVPVAPVVTAPVRSSAVQSYASAPAQSASSRNVATTQSTPSVQTPNLWGTAGNIKLSSGYEVALNYGGQEQIDKSFSALYYPMSGNTTDDNGNLVHYTLEFVYDHDYDLYNSSYPAAHPAVMNSDTMWINTGSGTRVLHKKWSVWGNSHGDVGNGDNVFTTSYCWAHGATLVFQTCENGGDRFTLWG